MTTASAPAITALDRARGALRIGRALRLVWASSRRLTIANLVVAGLQAVIPIMALYLLKLVIDAVTAGIGSGSGEAFRHVLVLVAMAALVGMFDVILSTLGGLINEAQGMFATDYVSSLIHAKSARLDLQHYEDPAYQDLLLRTQQEAPFRPPLVLKALLGIARSTITLAGIVGLLLTAHWLLVVLLLAVALPGLVVRLRFAKYLDMWKRRRVPLERLTLYLNHLLGSPLYAKELRMFELGPFFGLRFQEVRKQLREEGLRISRRRGMAEMSTQILAALAVFAGIAFIAHQALAGLLTVGSLVMYVQAVNKGQSLFSDLATGVSGLYEHNLFLAHLDEFLALQSTIVAPEQPASLGALLHTGLEVQGVSFQYPSSSHLSVRNVTLRVGPGEMVAVVGANGSGKTTLMKLICRLYDPSSGRIMLEGKDIREYDPQELRRRIAILFQDHKLFEFSGAENIWFGSIRSPRDDRRIARAAHLSGADGLFRRLPRGLDTLIGRMFEGSQDLSGGERQKVALARALYSDAGILILDEPSSALDPQAEADLFRHLREQTAGRAVVVISHRFSTVRMADRIYVLDDGGVIEAGTHDELMELEGTYSRLFELQAAAYRSGAAGTYEPLSPDVVERAPGAGQCLNETGSLSL